MNRKLLAGAGLAALAAGIFSAGAAQATEGYFLSAVGVNQTALSGAGVANSEDAMAMTINPAGIAGMDRQIATGAALMYVDTSFKGTGTALLPSGSYTSADHLIPGGNFAYIQPLGDLTVGFAIYPNGGTATNYGNMANTGGACYALGLKMSGLYCDNRRSGIALRQEMLQLDIAGRSGNISYGIGPVIAAQSFDVTGVRALGNGFFSASPGSVTDNGNEWSFGIGVHAGLEWRVTPQFRVGLSGATETYMSSLSHYAGILANQGEFDIPAWIQAGVAYDINPAWTVMADYKRIFYSDVATMGDSPNVYFSGKLFGSSDGPGLGWRDVDVVAVGATYKATRDLTLRVGAEFNTQPVQKSAVWFNVLSPAVTTSQFSAGMSYRLNAKTTFDFSGYIVPNNTISGPEHVPGMQSAVNPTGLTGGTVKISTGEAQVMAGLTYHFDAK